MKKLISLILALILVLGVIPVSGFVPAQAASRSYGSVPILIGDPETDLMADRILASIPTAGLSDREKILKVYDWIITHCQRAKDGQEIPWMNGPTEAEIAAYSKQMLARVDAGQAVVRKELASIYTDYTYGEKEWSYNHTWLDSNDFVENSGNYMMHTYVGTCVDFSSLFAVLLGHLGYDARIISGAYINNSGPVAHTWNLVLIGGKYYWFDIRIDHSITQYGSSISHAYFMKDNTDNWAKNHIWARGYSDLLESNASAIRALYEANDTHTHQWEADKWNSTAACETVGSWIQTCSVCKLRRVEYLALGHDWTVLNSWEPTCTEEGGKDLFCERCYKSEHQTIPAAGHHWSVNQILTPSQEDEHGTAHYLCSVCNAEKTAKLCATEIFTDAPKEGNWAHSGIDFCVFRGLMGGTAPTLFSPNTIMTRAMVVQILWAAEDKPEPTESCSFRDVRPNAWYAKAVAWAEETSLVGGVGEGQFAPTRTLTRQELAVILRGYAAYKGSDTDAVADLSAYPDVKSVSSWALPAMQWAFSAGILSGATSSDGVILAPKQSVSRAMAAVMLMRFLTAVESTDEDPA